MASLLHQYFSLSVSPIASSSSKGARISFGPITLRTLRKRKIASHCLVQCVANNNIEVSDAKTVVRRSANYAPAIWDSDYVESLNTEFTEEKYGGIIEGLKQEVRSTFMRIEDDPFALLEHIDLLQRLGLSYHFQNEINKALKGIYESTNHMFFDDKWKRNNLYATALEFRLFRQHGFWIPQDVFKGFKDAATENYSSATSDDILGLLSLYDASFYCVKGESILEEARELCRVSLEKYVNGHEKKKEDELSDLVSHALDMPLHWKVPRVEARWFIDFYKKRPNNDPSLLRFAKLDYNVVQGKYQKEMKEAYRWWRETGLAQNLDFARDRLVVIFLWSMGIVYAPQFGNARVSLAKVLSLVNVIDDLYDVYGTLHELLLFTDAVERWNINEISDLPDYMKICFFALHNTVNGLALDTLNEQRFNVVEVFKKAWTGLCKAYQQEAKWFYDGYTPKFEEYIENSWISISAPAMLTHAYISAANPITEEAIASLKEYPSVMRQSAMLIRLSDDLGTASDEIARGDTPKSIQCYMHEAGVSEEEAREHVKSLISEAWKQLNADAFENSVFPKQFLEMAKNLGRIAQCMYQHGDGTGVQDRETKDLVLSLYINPIPMED